MVGTITPTETNVMMATRWQVMDVTPSVMSSQDGSAQEVLPQLSIPAQAIVVMELYWVKPAMMETWSQAMVAIVSVRLKQVGHVVAVVQQVLQSVLKHVEMGSTLGNTSVTMETQQT
jgi:hypothetical protein